MRTDDNDGLLLIYQVTYDQTSCYLHLWFNQLIYPEITPG